MFKLFLGRKPDHVNRGLPGQRRRPARRLGRRQGRHGRVCQNQGWGNCFCFVFWYFVVVILTFYYCFCFAFWYVVVVIVLIGCYCSDKGSFKCRVMFVLQFITSLNKLVLQLECTSPETLVLQVTFNLFYESHLTCFTITTKTWTCVTITSHNKSVVQLHVTINLFYNYK